MNCYDKFENADNQPEKKDQPTKLSTLIRRANSLAERGRYDEAIQSIERAMALYPNEPECSLQLANIYRAQNRMNLAVQAMSDALDLDPKNPGLQEQLLRTLLEMGKYDEVVSVSQRLIKQFPRSVAARDSLGIAYMQQGEIDKALNVARELIKLAPTDPFHHFKKAVLLQQKGDCASAMEAFIQTVEIDPEGEIADDAREAIAALDSYQLRQILTLAMEDAVFKTKLMIDPESATRERGFCLSSGGIGMLRQIDFSTMGEDAQNRYYH